jgi:teichuronic acid exporter
MSVAPVSSPSLAQVFSVGVGWLLVGRVGYVIASVATVPILARLLTPTEFGVMAAITIVQSLASTLTESGFSGPVIQKEHLSTESRNAIFCIAAVFGLSLTVVISLSAPAIGSYFAVPGLSYPLIITMLILPVRSAAAVSKAIMLREHQYRNFTIATNLAYCIGYAIPAVTLAWLGYGIWALVIPTLIMTVLELAFILWINGMPGKITFRLGDSGILYSGLANTLTHVLNWGALSTPNIVVGSLLGLDALGLYSRAGKLFSLADQILVDSMRPAFLSGLSSLRNTDQRRIAFKRALSLLMPFYFVLSALLVFHAEAIVRIMLGSQWLAIVPVVQVLFFAFAGRTGYKTAEAFAMSTGQFASAAVRQALYLTLVVIGVGVGSRFGLIGVACGFAAAVWGFYLISMAWVMRLALLGKREIGLAHLRTLLIVLLILVADSAVSWQLADVGWLWSNVLGGAVGLLSAAVCFYYAPRSLIGSDLAWTRDRILSILEMQTISKGS